MDLQRRALFVGGGALAASAALGGLTKLNARPAPIVAQPPPPPAMPAPAVVTRPAADARQLFLQNLHTGDRLKTVYWENGAYVEDALDEARHVLRDWRNGEQHQMDPELFDIFHGLRTRLEVDRPFQIISGYRSPATNAKLAAQSSGVAKRSLHMQGKAVDLRLEGVDLRHVRKAALDMGAGGVGFYPRSNFVHVDTGRVRQWSGA